MRRLLGAFGRDAFRVELQRPLARHDRALNRGLAGLAQRLGVAGGRDRQRPRAHAASARTCRTPSSRSASTRRSTPPSRCGAATTRTSSRRRRRWRRASPITPRRSPSRSGWPQTLSFDLCERSRLPLPRRGGRGGGPRAGRGLPCALRRALPRPQIRCAPRRPARLEEELRVIDDLGLAGFFLLHRDLLELAREVAVEVRGTDTVRALLPPGRGRGSSVSSIVCYLTGLSHVDPIANKLLLGRFLNEELTALPDIDLDFPRDVREVLIPRVHERYGRERSALVAAFPTYRARGAIRELGKALGLPPGEIERVARGSEGWSSREVDRDIGTRARRRAADRPLGLAVAPGRRGLRPAAPSLPALGRDDRRDAPARGLRSARARGDGGPPARAVGQGLLRGRGLSEDRPARAGDAVGAVERCVEHIAARRGERIDLSRIPYDDPATYECIQNADTTGVFQIESRAQMGSLRRTRPETLDDITIQVAIVRPGPIVGGAVNPYIERRQRLRVDPAYEVPYLHPSLEPPLRDTLGTIIFQDQVLEVAQAFAGFSAGEAEGLRRAMSRKRSAEAIEAHHQRFVEGAMATHPDVTEELAERGLHDGLGLLGLRLSQGPRRRLRAARLPVDVAARALRARVSLRAARRAADGLLSARRARPRGAAARDRGASRRTSTPARSAARSPIARRRSRSAWATCSACAPTRSRRSSPRAARAGAVSLAGGSRLARRRGPGGARAARLVGRLRRARRRRSPRRAVAARGGRARRCGARARGRSSRSRSTCPRRRSCSALSAWDAMVADYATTGLTAATHPIGLLRAAPATRRRAVDVGAISRGWRTARACGSAASSSRASGRGPRRASRSCCSRTSTGRSTSSSRRRSTSATGSPCAPSRSSSSKGGSSATPSAGGAINVLARQVRRLEVARPRGRAGQGLLAARRARARAPGRGSSAAARRGTDDFRAVAPPVHDLRPGAAARNGALDEVDASDIGPVE